MEGRLQRSIKDGDFYSTHQLLLSHSQRLERNGKLMESGQFLYNGIIALNSAKAPIATLFDVVGKFLAVARQLSLEDVSESNVDYLKVLEIVLSYDDVPDCFTDFWTEVASGSVEFEEGYKVVELLLEKMHDVDKVLCFALSRLPFDSRVFTLLGSYSSSLQVLFAGLDLFLSKCFASAVTLNESFSAAQTDLKVTKTISGIVVYEEISLAGRVANLLSFLTELLRRKNPPRDSFVQLQLRYADLLQDVQCKRRWDRIREANWPVQSQSGQGNPLASLLQSMMTGQ
jgi:hypothetical protein